MNCRFYHQHYEELISPGSDPSLKDELKIHLGTCPDCARHYAAILRTLAALEPSHEVQASQRFKEKVMNRILDCEREAGAAPHSRFGRFFWKPALALGVLAVVLAAGSLSGVFKGSSAAYALEKTLEANRGVRFIHMKMEPVSFGHVSESWARFDERGQLLNLRFDFPDTEDGPKVVNWQADKAEVWFKKKNGVAVVREVEILKKMKMTINDFDPRKMVEDLFARQHDGTKSLELNIVQGDGPVLVNVIDKKAGGRTVYKVDVASHLVTAIEKYRPGKTGVEELAGRTRYLDYNSPGPEDVFTLHPPESALRVDETTQVIGIEKGNLSDKEVAQKAVREFFEALIAKDYAKAGQIFSGCSAAKMEQAFGKMNFTRIVSIGEPTPYEPNRSLRVPCEIEYEADGKKEIMKPFGPFVRAVYSDPNRREIIGGI